jgi:hypothetical protein
MQLFVRAVLSGGQLALPPPAAIAGSASSAAAAAARTLGSLATAAEGQLSLAEAARSLGSLATATEGQPSSAAAARSLGSLAAEEQEPDANQPPPNLFGNAQPTATQATLARLLARVRERCGELAARHTPVVFSIRMHELRLAVNAELFRFVDGSCYYDGQDLRAGGAFLAFLVRRDARQLAEFLAAQRSAKLAACAASIAALPPSDEAARTRQTQTMAVLLNTSLPRTVERLIDQLDDAVRESAMARVLLPRAVELLPHFSVARPGDQDLKTQLCVQQAAAAEAAAAGLLRRLLPPGYTLHGSLLVQDFDGLRPDGRCRAKLELDLLALDGGGLARAVVEVKSYTERVRPAPLLRRQRACGGPSPAAWRITPSLQAAS